MPLRVQEDRGSLTVFLAGELDHRAARELMLALDREVARRAPVRLRVDMGEVSFMDSSGIAVLLRAWKRMDAAPDRMRVVRVPPQAKKVFHAAGLDKLIPMEP